MTKKKTVVLLDGDIIVYQVCFGAEVETKWPNGTDTLYSSPSQREYGVRNFIEYIEDRFKADKIIIAFSPPKCFRNDILPSYKQNRAKSRKPFGLKETKEWMKTEWTCLTVDNIEADDLLGIMATGDKVVGRKIICSKDKDFMQIPGEYYNTLKQELHIITEEEANLYFYRQIIIGDSVDNYKGVPGIGPVGAAKFIKEGMTEEQMWENVVKAYKSKELTEEDALVQARCARILRSTEWDSNKQEIILWNPNTTDTD
jgi:DNA polymerase-1